MIRDVSKQYAAFFTEAEEEDQKYTKACEEACKKEAELKEQEIREFDEEEIDPVECGFTEEEIHVDEVVDPLQMWKDAKAKEADKKPSLVKVDNNYINTMKKLLSGIKTSKKAVYDRICGPNGKLQEYLKAGTMLPPPEDFAENFISFEEISKMVDRSKDKIADEKPEAGEDVQKSDDIEGLGDEDVSLASRAAGETKDADNVFGNDIADQNLWDCDLTEAEDKEIQDKAKEELKTAKKEIKDVDEETAAEFLKKNDAKIKDALGKIKDQKVKDDIKKLVKVVGKFADGKIDDSMITEAKNKGHIIQFIKATLRMLTWMLMIVPAGLLASAWVAKGLGKVSQQLISKVDMKLAESLTLEVCDEEELEENKDIEELDETGCEAKKAEDKIREGEQLEEADYREPISHALDPIGVKASTASLAAQDTAAISVVEKLLNKIEKLEAKIELLESRAEKNSIDAATSKSVKEADISFEDLDDEKQVSDEKVKVTKTDLDSSKKKFLSGLDKLSKEETKKVFDEMADRIQDSLDKQKEAGADPTVRHTQAEVNDAVKKINFFRNLSYEKELSDEQKKQFADLVYKFWYDWICIEKKDEDGETILEPVKSVKDMLMQPFTSFFGRPGNHNQTLTNDFKIHSDGYTYILQPFQFTRDPYEELKTTKARRAKQEAKDLQAAADAGKGFKPAKGRKGQWIADNPDEPLREPAAGEKGTWTINDWNHMMGTLTKSRRDEIEKELRAEIEQENPSDEFTKARELAFLKMIFNRAGSASAANSDYFIKIQKEKNKKLRQLNALKRDMESQLDKISSKIADLEKKQKELKKRLADNPDDTSVDDELADVNFDLETAWNEFNDKEEEIRDMAANADDYLKNYSGEHQEGVDDIEDPEDIDSSSKSNDKRKVKAQDLRKFSGIATVDLAPTMLDTKGKPYDVHAFRSFEKHTIDSILQALADVTGIYDEKKLMSALSEMSDSQFREFLGEIKDRGKRKPKNKTNTSDKPTKAAPSQRRSQYAKL